jgi:flagellar hook-length control protein FliK
MNDTLVSLPNLPACAPTAGAAGPANRAKADEPTARSFADVADAINAQQIKKSQDPEKRENTNDPLEALLAALSQTQAQAAAQAAEDGPQDEQQNQAHALAMDAAETLQVSYDTEVNGLPHPSPQEQLKPLNRADLTNMRWTLIKPDQVVNLTNTEINQTTTESIQAVPTETKPVAVVMEALRQSMAGTPVFESGEKALSASFMEMRARLAALSHDLGLEQPAEEVDQTSALAETDARPAQAPAAEYLTAPRERTREDAGGADAGIQAGIRPAAPRHNEAARESTLFTPVHTAGTERAADKPFEAPVTPSQIIRQIVETTAVSQTGNISRIKLQLNPEFLGKISIVLTAAGDGLTARIHAQNGAVSDMLSANLLKLQSELRDMGINMKSIDIFNAGLTGDMARGHQGHRSFGHHHGSDGAAGDRPVTLARFHQAIRAPQASVYDGLHMDGRHIDDGNGVDFWA